MPNLASKSPDSPQTSFDKPQTATKGLVILLKAEDSLLEPQASLFNAPTILWKPNPASDRPKIVFYSQSKPLWSSSYPFRVISHSLGNPRQPQLWEPRGPKQPQESRGQRLNAWPVAVDTIRTRIFFYSISNPQTMCMGPWHTVWAQKQSIWMKFDPRIDPKTVFWPKIEILRQFELHKYLCST